MIPSSQSAYNIYSGGSAATVFDFEFEIESPSDLVVILYNTSTDTNVTLEYNTDYTISEQSVTLSSAPVSNEKVILLSSKKVQQQYDFYSSGKFDPQKYEDALDYVVNLIKQNERDVERAIKMPFGVTGVDVTMPAPSNSKLLKWNIQGNKIENSSVDADELESMASRLHDSIDNIDAVANNLDKIEDCLDNLDDIKNAPIKAAEAKASATSAASSATAAATSESNAASSATSAASSATAAATSESNAASSATSAATSATAAATSESNAASSATSAATSATAAATSESNAASSATSAASSAQSLQENITSINAKIKQNEDNIAKNKADIKSISESYGGLSTRYNQFVQEDYKEKEAIKKTINANASEVADIKQKLTAKIEANTTEINSVRSRSLVNANDIDELQQYTYSKYGEIKNRIESNETSISNVSSDLSDTKTSLSDLKELVEKQGSAAYTRFAINKANCFPYSCDIDICNYEWVDVSYNDYPVVESIGLKIGGDYSPLVFTNANGKTFEITETPTSLLPANYHHSRNEDNWEQDMVYVDSTGIHVEASCGFYVTNSTDIIGQVPEGHTGIVLCTNSEPLKAYLVKNGVVSEFGGVPLFSFETNYTIENDVPKYFFTSITESILKKIGYNAYSFNTNVLPYGFLANVNNTVLNIEYADAQYDKIEIDLSKALYYFSYKAKFNFEFKTNMNEEISVYLHTDAYQAEIEDKDIVGQYIGRTSGGVLKTSFDADIVGQKITLYFVSESGAKVKFDKAMLTMLTAMPQNITSEGFVHNEDNDPVYGDGSICYVIHVQDDDDITLTHTACCANWSTTDADILSGMGTLTIDWGDGVVENFSGSDWNTKQQHTYQTGGDYTVKITCDKEDSLCAVFGGSGSGSGYVYGDVKPSNWIAPNQKPSCKQIKKINSVPPRLGLNMGVGDNLNLSSIPNNLFAISQQIGGVLRNTAITSISKLLFGRKKTSEFLINGGNPTDSEYYKTSGAIFQDCKNITKIPEDLFENFDSITNLPWCFRGCTSLATISGTLFKNMPNLQDCEEMFRDCSSLTQIPENLFEGAADSLQELQGMFALTGLVSIPEKLFEYLPNWKGSGDNGGIRNRTNFKSGLYRMGILGRERVNLDGDSNNAGLKRGVFSGCYSLANIPAGLFAQNGQLEKLYACFQNCKALTSIPENLFANNPKLKNFGYCFDYCHNMVLNSNIFGEDNTRFANLETTEDSPLNLDYCFRIDGSKRTTQLVGTAPDLWNWELPDNVSHTGCFAGHSAATLSNYSEIPDDWK